MSPRLSLCVYSYYNKELFGQRVWQLKNKLVWSCSRTGNCSIQRIPITASDSEVQVSKSLKLFSSSLMLKQNKLGCLFLCDFRTKKVRMYVLTNYFSLLPSKAAANSKGAAYNAPFSEYTRSSLFFLWRELWIKRNYNIKFRRTHTASGSSMPRSYWT
jgi:hypothetical protein